MSEIRQQDEKLSSDLRFEVAEKEQKGYVGVGVSSVTSQLTHHVLKNENDLDAAAHLAGTGVQLSPEEAKMILSKIDWKVLPFVCTLYLTLFLNKAALGTSVLLGLKQDNNLSQAQYNWLATIFFVSYLMFVLPQSLGLQRFPVSKYLALNITCWGVFLMLHAACHDFTGLMIVRFLTGVSEASVIAGTMIIIGQYYTSVEQGQRIGASFVMSGLAQIISGSMAYGINHIHSDIIKQWQILFMFCGTITILLGVSWWFLMPDSPVTASFLTPLERVMAIERIRENQTGIENKTWKRYQFIEALTDVKILLFIAFTFIGNIPSGLVTQYSTLYTELGFTTPTSTLLALPTGLIEIVTIGFGIWLLGRFKNSRAIISILFFIPCLLGASLVIWLPFSNKIGILCALYIIGCGHPGMIICFAWLQTTNSGHTKKTTAMFMNLSGSSIGSIIGPQLFQAQYAPENTIPFAIILACFTICPIIILIIRQLLVRENKRRDLLAEAARADGLDNEEEYVDIKHADGTITIEKVDLRWRDLTDKENLEFRYCL